MSLTLFLYNYGKHNYIHFIAYSSPRAVTFLFASNENYTTKNISFIHIFLIYQLSYY